MLTKGDLVRIPQSSKLMSANPDSWRYLKLQKPKIAILLKSESDKSIVLIDDVLWEVNTKDVQLFRGEKCL